jgi:tetratricopeptide (TPR) repeat protein
MKKIRMVPLLCGLVCGGFFVSTLPEISEARSRKSRRSREKRKMRKMRKKAKRLFKQAQKKYRLGRFVQARALYEKAYDLLPLPGFLYNIAQCHRMEKRYDRAVFFYKSYLSARSSARNRDMVQMLIAKCIKQLRLIEKRKRDALNRSRTEAEQRRAERLALLKAKLAASRPPPRPRLYLPPKKPVNKPLVKQWWFWSSIAGGVVALVVTGVAVGLATSRGSGDWTDTSLGLLDRR